MIIIPKYNLHKLVEKNNSNKKVLTNRLYSPWQFWDDVVFPVHTHPVYYNLYSVYSRNRLNDQRVSCQPMIIMLSTPIFINKSPINSEDVIVSPNTSLIVSTGAVEQWGSGGGRAVINLQCHNSTSRLQLTRGSYMRNRDGQWSNDNTRFSFILSQNNKFALCFLLYSYTYIYIDLQSVCSCPVCAARDRVRQSQFLKRNGIHLHNCPGARTGGELIYNPLYNRIMLSILLSPPPHNHHHAILLPPQTLTTPLLTVTVTWFSCPLRRLC